MKRERGVRVGYFEFAIFIVTCYLLLLNSVCYYHALLLLVGLGDVLVGYGGR